MIKKRIEQEADWKWMEVAKLIDLYGNTDIIYTRPSLIYAKNKLGEGTVGAEIGVWDGCNSEAIMRLFKPSKLYLIDPWFLYDGFIKELQENNFGEEYFKQETFDKIYQSVVRKFDGNSIVEVMRGMSEDRAKDIPDESLDWVYVDGSHHEEYVYKDCVNYWPKIKPGGILCGHDFLFPEIPPALERFSNEKNLVVWPYGSDWWVNK